MACRAACADPRQGRFAIGFYFSQRNASACRRRYLLSRLKTKLTRRTLRGSSLCRGCLIFTHKSLICNMTRLIVALATCAALGNAFVAPVARPVTRAAVRVQVGVPRIDLPAQIVRITASDEPSLTHGCNGKIACSNEQFSSNHRARSRRSPTASSPSTSSRRTSSRRRSHPPRPAV